MATTISSAITGPFTLSPSSNPLSITAKGKITSTGANIDGIDGDSGTAWAITNGGTVSSAGGWGINLAGAGSLSNSGVISGASGGIQTRGVGTVTNKGTISSSNGNAVYFASGGTVTNQADQFWAARPDLASQFVSVRVRLQTRERSSGVARRRFTSAPAALSQISRAA
jgi:hypothetical protein